MHIAITGHRPKDLTTEQQDTLHLLVDDMLERVLARDSSTPTFHVGGALGVDQRVHRRLLHLGIDQPVHTILHSPGGPFKQGARWDEGHRQNLADLMAHSTKVCLACREMPMTSTSFARDLNRRNECMVQQSNVLIAFWNGKRWGGTFNCIQYARRTGVPVYNAFHGFDRVLL